MKCNNNNNNGTSKKGGEKSEKKLAKKTIKFKIYRENDVVSVYPGIVFMQYTVSRVHFS